MNISTGMASPDILANNSILPRFHVLSSVNAAEAITSGNQPPREILVTLAPKKALSMSKKAPASGMTSQMLQRQSRTITSVSSTESISMVPVTATPKTEAKLLEDWKPNTNTVTATSKVQFTNGTKKRPTLLAEV